MTQRVEEDWPRAAFLGERAVDSAPLDDRRRAAAEQRARRWQSQSKLDDEAFGARLSRACLTWGDFVRLLALGGGPAQGATNLRAFAAELERVLADEHRDLELPALGRLPTGSNGLPFASLLRPFLARGLWRLREGLRAAGLSRNGELLDARAEADLLKALAARLQLAVTRTMILELNIARGREQLQGATPEERFAFFSDAFYDPPARRRELLLEYQALARLLVAALDHWVAASLEILERVAADREAVAGAFGDGSDPGPVTSFEQGISDAHRRGRGVCRVSFASGLEVMLKPRRMDNDAAFQGLLGWLNDAGLRHPQRLLGVLPRGEYGWVERVAATPCLSHEQVQRFYWRQGSFLALLHLLQATDFHYENLIAVGEHPVLVDLEALFHPPHERPDDGLAVSRAQRRLAHSVLSVGLLPMLVWGRNRRVADLSGLGGAGGQVFPRQMPTVEARDTDVMRIAVKDVAIPAAHNRPRLGEQEIDAGAHGDDLAAGFEETRALLRARGDELRRRLRAFEEVEVRFIARPTMRYALFLQESLHPDYLRDAVERERVFDRLWAETNRREHLRALVPAELDDLRLGDVPLFVSRPGARDLWDSRGQGIADYFPETSLDGSLRRVAALDDAAYEREQLELIRQSVVPALGPSGVSQPDEARSAEQAPRFDPQAALAAALRLGEHLAAQAVLGERDATWIGPRLRPGEHWRWEVAPLAWNLYEGLAGVALFLAQLARQADRPEIEELARRASEPLLADLRRRQPTTWSDVGAFSGRAGVTFALWHLARLWGDAELLDAALETLPGLLQHVPADAGLDVLTGAAGCAQVMLGLHRDTGEALPLEVARACAERLLAAAEPQQPGLGWVVSAARLPLAGFSHGVAGIAWTLLDLALALGDERLREAALGGLAYERSLFQPGRGNWLDRREWDAAGQGFHTFAWCHGAAGVAFGRALSLRHVDDALVREEIAVGVESTLRHGFGGNQSLCHGDLGNAEMVVRAAELLGRDDWRAAALAQAARVTREVLAGEWRCGLPRHTSSPALMTGLAGIGYGLLRLRAPEQVPSVLALEPPVRPGPALSHTRGAEAA